jgi:hypothetical protein
MIEKEEHRGHGRSISSPHSQRRQNTVCVCVCACEFISACMYAQLYVCVRVFGNIMCVRTCVRALAHSSSTHT